MPELAETSETESVRGCNSNLEDQKQTGKTAEASKGREVFPSISDDMLAQLKLKFKRTDTK